MEETFKPPTEDDFKTAWSIVRCIDVSVTMPARYAQELARVVYAAERARKLLSGMPTRAEADQQ